MLFIRGLGLNGDGGALQFRYVCQERGPLFLDGGMGFLADLAGQHSPDPDADQWIGKDVFLEELIERYHSFRNHGTKALVVF